MRQEGPLPLTLHQPVTSDVGCVGDLYPRRLQARGIMRTKLSPKKRTGMLHTARDAIGATVLSRFDANRVLAAGVELAVSSGH